MLGMGGMPSYGGMGGFGLLDPSLMTALGQNPQFGHILDAAGVPPPQTQLSPDLGGFPSLGDILGGGAPAAPGAPAAAGPSKAQQLAQIAQPKVPEAPRLTQQNAPQVGKAPGNPLMEMLLATMMSGARPGMGR